MGPKKGSQRKAVEQTAASTRNRRRNVGYHDDQLAAAVGDVQEAQESPERVIREASQRTRAASTSGVRKPSQNSGSGGAKGKGGGKGRKGSKATTSRGGRGSRSNAARDPPAAPPAQETPPPPPGDSERPGSSSSAANQQLPPPDPAAANADPPTSTDQHGPGQRTSHGGSPPPPPPAPPLPPPPPAQQPEDTTGAEGATGSSSNAAQADNANATGATGPTGAEDGKPTSDENPKDDGKHERDSDGEGEGENRDNSKQPETSPGAGQDAGEQQQPGSSSHPGSCEELAGLLTNWRNRAETDALAGYQNPVTVGQTLWTSNVQRAIAAVSESVRPSDRHLFALLGSNTFQDAELGNEAGGHVRIVRPGHRVLIPWTSNIAGRNGREYSHTSLFIHNLDNSTPGDTVLHRDSANGPGHRDHPEIITQVRDRLRTLGWFEFGDTPDQRSNQYNAVVDPNVTLQSERWDCGLHVIFNAWAYALQLDLSTAQYLDRERYREFTNTGAEIIGLAVQGHMDSHTIWAFLDCFGFIAPEQTVDIPLQFNFTQRFLNERDFNRYAAEARLEQQFRNMELPEGFTRDINALEVLLDRNERITDVSATRLVQLFLEQQMIEESRAHAASSGRGGQGTAQQGETLGSGGEFKPNGNPDDMHPAIDASLDQEASRINRCSSVLSHREGTNEKVGRAEGSEGTSPPLVRPGSSGSLPGANIQQRPSSFSAAAMAGFRSATATNVPSDTDDGQSIGTNVQQRPSSFSAAAMAGFRSAAATNAPNGNNQNQSTGATNAAEGQVAAAAPSQQTLPAANARTPGNGQTDSATASQGQQTTSAAPQQPGASTGAPSGPPHGNQTGSGTRKRSRDDDGLSGLERLLRDIPNTMNPEKSEHAERRARINEQRAHDAEQARTHIAVALESTGHATTLPPPPPPFGQPTLPGLSLGTITLTGQAVQPTAPTDPTNLPNPPDDDADDETDRSLFGDDGDDDDGIGGDGLEDLQYDDDREDEDDQDDDPWLESPGLTLDQVLARDQQRRSEANGTTSLEDQLFNALNADDDTAQQQSLSEHSLLVNDVLSGLSNDDPETEALIRGEIEASGSMAGISSHPPFEQHIGLEEGRFGGLQDTSTEWDDMLWPEDEIDG